MKLADINHEAVRDEVLTSVLGHLHAYGMPLMTPGGDPRGVVVPSIEDARQSTLGFEALAVAHYAITGEWIAPGETEGRPELGHSFAWDALTQVVTALYSSPLGDVPVPLDAETDPDTAWGVVLTACVARHALAQGQTISAQQLATLSGVTRQRIAQLADAGELERARPSGITADSARRWLAARGIA